MLLTLYQKFLAVFDKGSATQGQPKVVLELLRAYMRIGKKKKKIFTLLKTAYLREFEANDPITSTKRIDWYQSFMEYIKRFGDDADIQKVAKELGVSHILAAALQTPTLQCDLKDAAAETLLVESPL